MIYNDDVGVQTLKYDWLGIGTGLGFMKWKDNHVSCQERILKAFSKTWNDEIETETGSFELEIERKLEMK
jgi:hypothetical protein